MSSLATLAGRVGRYSVTYAAGMVVVAAVGLVTLAVLTRLMPPSEFGRLAVLLVFAGGLTMLYTLGTLQGILGTVFGKGDEDMGEADDLDASSTPAESTKRKPELLGTGWR